MDLARQMRDHAEATKATKTDACRRNGGPTDLHPMLIWVGVDGKANIALMEAKGGPMGYLPPALSLVSRQNPTIVIYVAESYGKILDPKTSLSEFEQTHEHGALAREHERLGPLSGVEELIALSGLDLATGEQMQAVCRFGYDDWGIPKFEETDIQMVQRSNIGRASVTLIFDAFYQFMAKMGAEKS
ncbi:MAG: hypothetical protein FJ275_10040 [Planctomycetes bacterium]|nr:hypothetical protein [Planctomycetota bacterium]